MVFQYLTLVHLLISSSLCKPVLSSAMPLTPSSSSLKTQHHLSSLYTVSFLLPFKPFLSPFITSLFPPSFPFSLPTLQTFNNCQTGEIANPTQITNTTFELKHLHS
ncbi:hypothetical protein N431DRAFT_196267 [Stipitochalara longipes BDJ]|nr:hypothetical protein N431DRAFT_196267 [Stipitochalara longipes BDJ]